MKSLVPMCEPYTKNFFAAFTTASSFSPDAATIALSAIGKNSYCA